jgi:hypothetical protein
LFHFRGGNFEGFVKLSRSGSGKEILRIIRITAGIELLASFMPTYD